MVLNNISSEKEGLISLIEQLKNDNKEKEERIKRLLEELTEKNELYLYAKAEVENIEKKCFLENERLQKITFGRLMSDIFLLSDSIEYGLCFEKIYYINKDDTFKEFDLFVGLRFVYEMLLVFFEKNAIIQINPIGKIFNPKEHEAIMSRKVFNVDQNIILEVIKKGYCIKDFICRHTQVVVSS